MSDLTSCVRQAVDKGLVSEEEARSLEADLAAHEAAPGAPDRVLQAIADREADIARRKANAMRQARGNEVLKAQAKAHPAGAYKGAQAVFGRDVTGLAKYGNVDSMRHQYRRRLRSMVTDGVKALRSKRLGLKQDFELGREVALVLRGFEGEVRPEARTIAGLYRDAFEQARLWFNEQGGDIKKLAAWGTPQPHNVATILAPNSGWKDFIKPLLDREAMRLPNNTPVSEKALKVVLDSIYRSFATGQPATISYAKAGLANTRLDHRILLFKDAESWAKYNDKFGNPDIFAAFSSHLDAMADEIGTMRVLGPNPESGYVALSEAVAEEYGKRAIRNDFSKPVQWARKRGWQVGGGAARLASLDSHWRTLNPQPSVISGVAQVSTAIRHLNTATKLGGAALSSLADEGTMAMTAAYNGLSSVRLLQREIEQYTSEEARIFAHRAWIGWESWMRAGVATSRFADEAIGKGYLVNAAEFTMRASGLNAMTDGRRSAFGMEFLGALGDLTKDSLDGIRDKNPRLAAAMERYGITAADWDIMRGGTVDFEGAKYVHPEAILDYASGQRGEDAVEKLMRMVLTETDHAVLMPGSRERAMLGGGIRAGTPVGEVLRHLLQFKTFSATMMLTHGARFVYQPTAPSKVGYLAAFLGMTTLGGALAIQAKSLAFGKKSRDMSEGEFWLAAAAQGGGLGLIGDFFYQGIQGQNRFGSNPLDSMLGPSWGLGKDTAALFFDSVGGDLAPRSVTQYATRHLIPGSSLWQTRLLLERTLIDQINKAWDPGSARRSFAAKERYAREQGSKYYWRPGEKLPEFLRQ